jgi:DNA-binding transcriptional ArsR family regulator
MPMALLDQPEHVRLALSPLRRQLLERLREPASATQLAAELTLGRQRVNYHLRALEQAGLIELIEERQRRGCVERILAARARAFVVDPSVMGAPEAPAVRAAAQDRFAANHLINSAAATVRDVARMQARAEQQGTRLLTFTIDTEISFATPQDLERFTTALAAFVARQVAHFAAPDGGRRYRVLLGGHPAPRPRPIAAKKAKKKDTTQPSGARHERDRSRPRRDSHRRTH